MALERTGKRRKFVSRRTFLDHLFVGTIGASLLAFIGFVFRFIWPPRHASRASAGTRLYVADLSKLPEGHSLLRLYRGSGVLLVHTASGLAAVGLKCTHLSCNVRWNPDKQIIECPCHGGTFDLQGNVLSGPPPRPLPTFRVEVIDDRIYITGAD
jgi:cytochrome b6-f complex iron-sulfur subunit